MGFDLELFFFFVLSKAEGQEIQAFNVICQKKAQVYLNWLFAWSITHSDANKNSLLLPPLLSSLMFKSNQLYFMIIVFSLSHI